jgi:hypothetical protein
MIRDKCIIDLPVHVSPGVGEVVHGLYLFELRKCDTPDKLKEFAKKWAVLFLMKYGNGEQDRFLTKEEEQIVNGTFNAEEALECIRKNSRGFKTKCKHIKKMQENAKKNPDKKNESCVGMHLMMPVPMLAITMIALRYRVPTDTAWIQISRAMNKDRDDEISKFAHG